MTEPFKVSIAGAKEIDNFWDGTISTDLWTSSGTGCGENVGTLYISNTAGSNTTNVGVITGKFDIRSYKYCTFFFSGYGYGEGNISDGGGNGYCLLEITDGTNASTILKFGAATGTSGSGYQSSVVGSGGYWVTLSYDGTNINVRRQGWSKYHEFLDTGYISYTDYTSVVADNTNINVSTWSSVKLRITGSGTGNSNAGNADGGYGEGFCTLAGLTVGSRKFGSKGEE